MLSGFYLAMCFMFTAAALAVCAFPVLVAPVRNDPERCARGRFTHWFMVAGYCFGGFVWFVCFPILYEFSLTVYVNPLSGLMIGVVLGNVIGRILGRRFKRQDEESTL